MKVFQDGHGGANERRAKGGKSIIDITHRYVDLFSDGPVIVPGNFINLDPPPSAIDSLWQALWKIVKACW